MKRMLLTITAGGFLLGSTGIGFADDPPEGRTKERKENQQTRIGNGIKNGSLTPKEAARLENKEAKLNKEIRTDRKVNGGNLTNKEKARGNRQKTRRRKAIKNKKPAGQHQKKKPGRNTRPRWWRLKKPRQKSQEKFLPAFSRHFLSRDHRERSFSTHRKI